MTFESENFEDYYLSAEIDKQGIIGANQKPESYHFRVTRGNCGAAGTISFQSYFNRKYFLTVDEKNKVVLKKEANTETWMLASCFFPRYDKFVKVRTQK